MLKVQSGVAFVALSELLNRGAVFLLGVVLARTMTPESFGVYGLVIAATGFLWLLADGGQTALGIRDIAGRRAPVDLLFASVIRNRTMAAAVVSASVIAISFALPREYSASLALGTGFILSQALFPAWFLRANQDFRGYFMCYGAVGLGFLSAILLVIVWPDRFDSAPAAVALRSTAWVLGAVLALYILIRQRFRRLSWWHQSIATPWRESVSLALAAIVVGAFPLLPMAGLSASRELGQLGILAAAWQLHQVVLAGGGLLHLVFFPWIYRYWIGDRSALKRVIHVHGYATVLAVAMVTFGYLLAGGRILLWLFGASYISQPLVLALLAVGFAGVACRYLGEAHLIAMEQHNRFVVPALVGATAGLVCLLKFGDTAVGAVLSYAVAESLYGVSVCILAFKSVSALPVVGLLTVSIPVAVAVNSSVAGLMFAGVLIVIAVAVIRRNLEPTFRDAAEAAQMAGD